MSNPTAAALKILADAHKPAAQDRFESVIEVALDETSDTSTVFHPASLAVAGLAAGSADAA